MASEDLSSILVDLERCLEKNTRLVQGIVALAPRSILRADAAELYIASVTK